MQRATIVEFLNYSENVTIFVGLYHDHLPGFDTAQIFRFYAERQNLMQVSFRKAVPAKNQRQTIARCDYYFPPFAMTEVLC